MRRSIRAVPFVLGVTTGSAALAGGYVASVAQPVPAAPVAQTIPADDWAGAYAGGSFGYAFGSDDAIGLDRYQDGDLIRQSRNLGQVDITGATLGLHAGYRWQRGNWVFGPELWIEGGSVDAADTVRSGPDVTVTSAINHLIGLQAKTGYVLGPQTLLYGTVGAVRGDLDYTLSDADGSQMIGYRSDGYTLGAGVERKLGDSLSVVAEWQYRNLDRTVLDFGDDSNRIVTRSTPDHHHLKLGINFNF